MGLFAISQLLTFTKSSFRQKKAKGNFKLGNNYIVIFLVTSPMKKKKKKNLIGC